MFNTWLINFPQPIQETKCLLLDCNRDVAVYTNSYKIIDFRIGGKSGLDNEHTNILKI